MGSLSSSVRYEESSMLEFVRLGRSHVKQKLVLVCPVPRLKWEGHRPFGTNSHEMRTCPRPSDTRNQSGRNSSVRYEVARMVSLSLSIRYEETSWLDFISLVRGIKWDELCPSITMSHETRACPCPSDTWNQANGSSSVLNVVVRMDSLSSFIRYEE